MTDKISNFTDPEIAAKQFQDATVFAYDENCPLTMRKNNRKISWWNQDLAERRKKVYRLFNVAKKSGNWTDYKRNLTDYNKVLRHAKTKSWRRHCEEILSKDERSAVSDPGRVIQGPFPWFRKNYETSVGWDGLELEFPKWKRSREDWAASKRVISYEKLKWAVSSFQPYKSPGIDVIMPIMLQQVLNCLWVNFCCY